MLLITAATGEMGMTNVEAIIASSVPVYKATIQADRIWRAKNSAAQPRKIDVYTNYTTAPRLVFRMRLDPRDATICWALIRELCEFRRYCRTKQGQALVSTAKYDGAAHLIMAELVRMKAARSMSVAQAAE